MTAAAGSDAETRYFSLPCTSFIAEASIESKFSTLMTQGLFCVLRADSAESRNPKRAAHCSGDGGAGGELWFTVSMIVPSSLLESHKAWLDNGCPSQPDSTWKVDSWVRHLPSFEEFLRGLGVEHLNRDDAIAVSPVVTDVESATQVFLLAMLWGYGTTGYGPYRTRRVLEQPETEKRLFEVAQVAQENGGLEAFRYITEKRASDRTYLKWLGPAFGTKYIYFLTAKSAPAKAAPVMDSVVVSWFRSNVPESVLSVAQWDVESYEIYLDSLEVWSRQLVNSKGRQLRPDEVEYLIFAGGRFGNTIPNASEAAQAQELAPDLLLDQLRAIAGRSEATGRALGLIDELESLLEVDPA